jgi:hypothetical protein
MPLWIVRGFLFVALAAAQSPGTSINQPPPPNIAGVWVLNPALTQRPAEIGFNPDWTWAGGQGGDTGSASGGRGRRGGSSSGGGAVGIRQMPAESADDATRLQQLTAEARTPPAHLTIVQEASTVSIADDQGLARTFHSNGKLEDLTIGTVALPTTARWDAGSLVVVYDVESGRQLRYTYTPSANPKRLLVDIRFIERKREGDEVRLTYETPDGHNDAVMRGAPTSSAAPAAPAGGSPTAAASTAPNIRPPVLPPGSELRGLKTITTEIEDLDAQAAACGLDQTKISNSISQVLSQAGFNPQTKAREDAYVVVSIATSKLPDGACVSRYDASLVSHADATFPYLTGTVAAVEVQLLHEGGMAGGSPGTHASAVMDALKNSVTHFVAQVRAAGK